MPPEYPAESVPRAAVTRGGLRAVSGSRAGTRWGRSPGVVPLARHIPDQRRKPGRRIRSGTGYARAPLVSRPLGSRCPGNRLLSGCVPVPVLPASRRPSSHPSSRCLAPVISAPPLGAGPCQHIPLSAKSAAAWWPDGKIRSDCARSASSRRPNAGTPWRAREVSGAARQRALRALLLVPALDPRLLQQLAVLLLRHPLAALLDD